MWKALFGDRGPKLLVDLFSLVGGQALSVFVGLLAFGYLARTLDPTNYGAVEYVIGLAAFFAIIVECGLGPIAARQLAQDNKLADQLATQISAARLIMAVAAVPVMAIVYFLAGERQHSLVWLFALGLFGVPWKQDWLLQGLDKMTQSAMAQTTRMTTFAIVVLLLVRKSDDVSYVGFAELTAAAVAVTYYLLAQYRLGIPLRFRLSLSESWSLIREGSSVGLSSMLWAFVLYAPLGLLTYFVGTVETAWYGAPQRIVVSLLNFSFIYFFNFYPVMASMLARPEEWRRLILSSYRLVAWAGIGLSLFLALLREPISRIVFGEDFGPAAPVFALLIWVLPIRLLSGHARWALIAGGRQRHLLVSEIVGTAILLVAALVAIPLAASRGAAIAAVLSNLGSWVAAHVFAEKHIGRLPPFQHLLAPAMAAIAGGASAWMVNRSPAVAAVVGLFTYGVCAVLFGGDLLSDVRRLAYSKTQNEILEHGSH